MGNVIDLLLARSDVRASHRPPSAADVQRLAAATEAAIPEALRELWQRTDGLELTSLAAHLLAPAEALRWIENDPMSIGWIGRGLLPFLDDHESNCLAVCLRDPLAFRVLHVPHDDGSRVLYRDLDACLQALVAAADSHTSASDFLFGTEGDYGPDAPRSVEDQDAAKALLAGLHTVDEWNHAVRLLDESNIDEWRRLMETGHFIRRDVIARMKTMRSPAIRALRSGGAETFDTFVTQFMQVLRDAGLPVGPRHEDNVKIGDSWYTVEAFFHRRHIPNAMPRMINWIKDQLAGEDPREREGNFMAD